MGITLSAVVVNYIRRQWRGLYLVTLPGGKSEQHYVSPRGGMLADINCRLIRFACTWTCRQTTWRPASPLSCGLMRLVSVALFVLSVLVRTVYVSLCHCIDFTRFVSLLLVCLWCDLAHAFVTTHCRARAEIMHTVTRA